jgi:5-methylcytosine-specific restriction protein A
MTRRPAWSGSHSRGFPTRTRIRILRRDPICRACLSAPSVEADHIIPKAEGGTDDESNGQGLCEPCHTAKTKAEIARARGRRSTKRPTDRHPGLR